MRDPQKGLPAPGALSRDSELSAATRLLGTVLWSYASHRADPVVWPNVKSLAEATAQTRRGVRGQLEALLERGWIERAETDDGRDGYRLLGGTALPQRGTALPQRGTTIPPEKGTALPQTGTTVPNSEPPFPPEGNSPSTKTEPPFPSGEPPFRAIKEETTQLNQPGEESARAREGRVIHVVGGAKTRDPRIDLEAKQLREWLVYHAPRPANGWPQLTAPTYVEERLGELWTLDRLKALVEGVVELADAGKLARSEWGGMAVFGQYNAEKLEARIEDHRAPTPTTSDGTPLGDRYVPPTEPDGDGENVHDLDELREGTGDLEVEAPFLRTFLQGGASDG